MLYSTILFAASAFSGLVAAQTSIDPNSVASGTRLNWCRAETNTCPVLCGGSFSNNTCDQNTLQYSCVCNDGTTPNMSMYQNTVASFVCSEWVGQCLANNAGNATAQRECQAVQCGSATASNVVAAKTSSASSSSAAASSSASATSAQATGSQTASGSAASSTSTGAAAALSVGREYGAGVLVASMFGLFAYAL